MILHIAREALPQREHENTEHLCNPYKKLLGFLAGILNKSF